MSCPICGTPAYEGVALSSGEVVHSVCLEGLSLAVGRAEQALSIERANLSNLRTQLAHQESYFGRIARFFGGGTDPADLRLRIDSSQATITAAEISYRDIRAKASPIYELMLDYPPDWSLRSAEVLARDKACTSCGSSNTLQAHHIVPLSKGGTNKLSNLKLLCERCHQRVHGGKDFSGSKSENTLAIADRVQVIGSAIARGADVEFMYKKPTDARHRRRHVTPHELLEVDHRRDDGSTLCMSGYCHLRRAQRTFALKRMIGLRIYRE